MVGPLRFFSQFKTEKYWENDCINSHDDALQNTVKICHSALGLSGYVSFFWWAYLRGGGLSKENL